MIPSQIYQSAGPALEDIQVGTGIGLYELLYPNWSAMISTSSSCEVWRFHGSRSFRIMNPTSSAPISLTGGCDKPLFLSPDGHYAVVVNVVRHVPSSWETYERSEPTYPKIHGDNPGVAPVAAHMYRPRQYQLLDLQRGQMSALIDAPLGNDLGFYDLTTAMWSHDSSEIILTNTDLPMRPESGAEGFHSTLPWVVAFSIGSRRMSVIRETTAKGQHHNISLTNIEWRDQEQQLVLRYFDDITPEVFQREGTTWNATTDSAVIRAAEEASVNRGLSVTVHQSLNEPPVLVASDRGSGKLREIWDPNPQFAGINFGKAEVYKWRDMSGKEWTAGLIKPPDYVAGRRYPLVIQTHGFDPNYFLTDGPGYMGVAMAARPMAARETVVLQIRDNDPDLGSIVFNPDARRDAYIAAIEQLDALGLIDPRRVGIIGFSITGWWVLDSLIHAGKHFTAATLDECEYTSYEQYILGADFMGAERAKDMAISRMATEPFGDGLQKWTSDSPGFNTDRIHAPILFEANRPISAIYAWDIYAALRLQHKPVEFLYIRNGDHVLSRPLEILASEETNVDWYDFWLNGHEDPDPAKAEQYARWRELRKLQQGNDAKDKAAKEKGVASN